ncbi:MAG: family 16 glycosylhydrolase [Aureispira sp.]|nr:family 16 glycosylhydrolase [Aureispira sp.]
MILAFAACNRSIKHPTTTTTTTTDKPLSTPKQTKFHGDFQPPDLGEGWQQFSKYFEKNTNYINEYNLTERAKNPSADSLISSSFGDKPKMIKRPGLEITFYPLDEDNTKQYQYTHQYNCVYDPKNPIDANRRYANIAYPNPCLGDSTRARARVVIKNTSKETKVLYCRMFYQNTSYWYATDSQSIDFKNKFFLKNYYGSSNIDGQFVPAGQTKELYLDYAIGKNPKGGGGIFDEKDYYGPARPGSYEFMLWVSEDHLDKFMQKHLNLQKTNPFAQVREWLNSQQREKVLNQFAYVPATHFKFVMLNENFDGSNNLNPGDVYILSDRDHKALCDTCVGNYFSDVISEAWTPDDFFKGYISKAPKIKAEYGSRKENVVVDTSGVYFKIPGSTPENKQKTWGEIKFMPGFLYGTVKVVAKLAQLRNDSTTPTGIVHNVWLYQSLCHYADTVTGAKFNDMSDSKGKQPYEIDIEIWSKIYDESWKDASFINYSIVDYMQSPNVLVQPGEEKLIDGHKVDRFNNYQMNYPGREELSRDFFDEYHMYEIRWTPHHITYLVDGEQKAFIDWRMADIPDEYAFLWISSPIYQDGTYYSQQQIPFLDKDHFSHIRYISIE